MNNPGQPALPAIRFLRKLPPMLVKRLLPMVVFAAALFAPEVLAHPEDEFCVPGEGSLDPALCEALAELDSANPSGRELEPILDEAGDERGFLSTAGLYITIGVRHILPAGLDHILFVLALLLTAAKLRPLVIQISTFTVAHTATLGLAAAGVISPPSSIIEPLIAATIAFVAIENLFLSEMPKWRPVLVFTFGLVHGLGFAGFFGELGLPPGQFWSALIGFNVGVEIGQLTVIVLAFLIARFLLRYLPEGEVAFRRYVVLPCSGLIATAGLVWLVQRWLAA